LVLLEVLAALDALSGQSVSRPDRWEELAELMTGRIPAGLRDWLDGMLPVLKAAPLLQRHTSYGPLQLSARQARRWLGEIPPWQDRVKQELGPTALTRLAPRSQIGPPSCAPTTQHARHPTQSTGGPPVTSPSTPARAGPCCAMARLSSTTIVRCSLTAVSRRSRMFRGRGSAPPPEAAEVLPSGRTPPAAPSRRPWPISRLPVTSRPGDFGYHWFGLGMCGTGVRVTTGRRISRPT